MGWLIASIIFGMEVIVMLGILLSGMAEGEQMAPIIASILFSGVISVLCFKKHKNEKNGITKESKKEKKKKLDYDKKKEIPGTKERNMELGAINNISAKHIAGLPIAEGLDCYIYLCSDKVIFERTGSIYNLGIEKINDISIKTDVEIQKAHVSSIGGAVGGAVLFGPLGAMIGGRSKEKTSKNLQKFLIFTYEKEDKIDYLSFDVTDVIKIDEFMKHSEVIPRKKVNMEL